MASPAIEHAATGRRKTAVARVSLVEGTGVCTVNKRPFEEFFPTEALRNYIMQPFGISDTADKYDISARTRGGGISGQAGALRHAISRALSEVDPEIKAALKKAGCLTRDARMKERKKVGQPGARKRFQFSKR